MPTLDDCLLTPEMIWLLASWLPAPQTDVGRLSTPYRYSRQMLLLHEPLSPHVILISSGHGQVSPSSAFDCGQSYGRCGSCFSTVGCMVAVLTHLWGGLEIKARGVSAPNSSISSQVDQVHIVFGLWHHFHRFCLPRSNADPDQRQERAPLWWIRSGCMVKTWCVLWQFIILPVWPTAKHCKV